MPAISQLPSLANLASPEIPEAGIAGAGRETRSKTVKDFEAMFLRQALEDMLPSQSSGAFGSESAGGVWRSMMADQLANVLAEKGILGLSQSLIAPGRVISGKGDE